MTAVAREMKRTLRNIRRGFRRVFPDLEPSPAFQRAVIQAVLNTRHILGDKKIGDICGTAEQCARIIKETLKRRKEER